MTGTHLGLPPLPTVLTLASASLGAPGGSLPLDWCPQRRETGSWAGR